jgi:hypothetical protein
MQDIYEELLSLSAMASFNAAFPAGGTFVDKTIRGRRYWYFDEKCGTEGRLRYVGPETPDLLNRVRLHHRRPDDEPTRQLLVTKLVGLGGLRPSVPAAGDTVAALSDAGAFRFRSVLIGTIAYQTYAVMLGTELPTSSVSTDDVDVAQFSEISMAIQDYTPPILEVLRQVDTSFRPVPNIHRPYQTVSYETAANFHVDFFTPNTGADSDIPSLLPALSTYAQPLRFLDFLIHNPLPSVLLHGAGVYVLVPAPQRYAVHKLIIASRRRTLAKRRKDILQAQTLLTFLLNNKRADLRSAWLEAYSRGRTWRRLLEEGVKLLDGSIRSLTLEALKGATY